MGGESVRMEPLVPRDVDLRDFAYTPVFRAQLFGSTFHSRASDSEWRAGFTLWLKSWDQVPAGSLPEDDIDLCRLADLGRDMKAWRKVKAMALRGWQPAFDGRLYHRVVAAGVMKAWTEKLGQRIRTMKARIEKTKKRLSQEKDEHEKRRLNDMSQGLSKSLEKAISDLSQANEIISRCLSQTETLSVTDDEKHEFAHQEKRSEGKGLLSKKDTLAKANDAEGVAQGDFLPPDPPAPAKPVVDKGLFGKPLDYLVATSGKSAADCRSLIGKWRKSHSDQVIMNAVTRAQVENAAQPFEFIIGCLNKKAREAEAPDPNRLTYGGI